MYLHYTHTTNTLCQMQARASRRAHTTTSQLADARYQWRRTTDKQTRKKLAREIMTLLQRANRYTKQTEHIQEELDWRGARDELVATYTEAGYKLVYLCGHKEFATEDEALGEAKFLHTRNDILREYGADGSWVEDMLDPEDMIQAQFRRKCTQFVPIT